MKLSGIVSVVVHNKTIDSIDRPIDSSHSLICGITAQNIQRERKVRICADFLVKRFLFF